MKSSDNFFQQFKQISKTIAMIISWTIFALLVLIIGFLAYYMVSANIYAKKGEKFEPKFSLYTIVSPSMEPNIKVYDVILNTRIDDPSNIKVGDVITFISTSTISNGMTVTHRVTRVVNGPDGLEFATKGDNNTIEDTDTAKVGNLLGKVVLKIPQLGRLQFFLSTKGGWLLIVLFPALLIIVNDILKIFKLNKAKKSLNEAEITSEDKEERIKLETFRKEEIKEKLNKKDYKKAKELENKLKLKKTIQEDETLTTNLDIKTEQKSSDKQIIEEVNKKDKIDTVEKPEFIPVIDEELLENKKEKEIETTDEKLEERQESDNVDNKDLLKESVNEENTNDITNSKETLEEIKFVPVNIDNSKKKKNNKNKKDINKAKESKKNKKMNIFDEEEPHNIFTENTAKELLNKKEPIKKENDIPLNFELPKLKSEK